MKRLPAILAISQALFLFSCGSDSAKEEAKADTTAAVADKPADVKPAFVPFKILVIGHKVKNFEKARAGYFDNDSLRKDYGITHYAIGRDLRDSNMVFAVEKIEDVDKAKTYFNSPKVKAAMAKAGVNLSPGFNYGVMVRRNDAPTDSTYHLAITHHVKDFDVWLKAFDAEGASNRAAGGLVDGGIARNYYDSNTVSVFFVVTDMAKARARVASPELKKVMADAGVDGTPTIRWYRQVK